MSKVFNSSKKLLNSKAWTVIKVCFSILILFFFYQTIDFEKLNLILKNVQLQLLLLVVLLVVVRNMISSWRFKVLCEHHKPVSFIEINKHYFIASLFNLFMPTSIGGDALRAVLLEREGINKSTALLFITVERFIGLFSFILIALIGLIFIPAPKELILLVVTINIAFMVLCLIIYFIKIPQFSSINILKKLRETFMLLKEQKTTLVKVSLISLLFQLFSIYLRYLLAVAFNLIIAFGYFLVFIPLINLVTLLPISIGGLGLREYAFVYFFTDTSNVLDKEASIILSLGTYIMLLATGAIGLIIYLYESFIKKNKNYAQ